MDRVRVRVDVKVKVRVRVRVRMKVTFISLISIVDHGSRSSVKV